MLNNKLAIAFILLILSLPVIAQKKEKPFQEWSKEDAQKILTDSPWAKTYQSDKGLVGAEQAQVAREQTEQAISSKTSLGTASSRSVPPPIVIRLNSALQIRQALVRLQQIAAGYDKMSESDRAKFDEGSKEFLACASCKNLYVVTITKFRNSGQGIDDGIFQTLKFEDLKGKVRLTNENGDERELMQFIPPKRGGESAVFFFQRYDAAGKTLITPQSKELNFVFSSDFLDNKNPYSVYIPRMFEFKVSKLVLDGNLAF